MQLAAETIIERGAARGYSHTNTALAWPVFGPRYPDPAATPSLFHVTGFRDWSRPCEKALRSVCGDAGVDYRIGYEHLDPDILGAIWDDLAGATWVVADVTLLNPNAVLELGIAHALGKPTLVISQTQHVTRHLPALAKVRSVSYSTDAAGLAALADRVRRFVSSRR